MTSNILGMYGCSKCFEILMNVLNTLKHSLKGGGVYFEAQWILTPCLANVWMTDLDSAEIKIRL